LAGTVPETWVKMGALPITLTLVIGFLVLLVVLKMSRWKYQKNVEQRNQFLLERGVMPEQEYREYCAAIGRGVEICDLVREVTARHLGIPSPELIRPTDRFHHELKPLGYDDVAIVEISVNVENYLGLKLPDRDYRDLETVDDFICYLGLVRDCPEWKGLDAEAKARGFENPREWLARKAILGAPDPAKREAL
jgi:acyl carrier protein